MPKVPGVPCTADHKRRASLANERTGIYKALRGLREGRDIIDKRTTIGKAIHTTYENLIEACGSRPSQAQLIECSSVRMKLAVQHIIARAIADSRGQAKEAQLKLLLQFSESIGRSLERLQRLNVSAPKELNLSDYIDNLDAANPGGDPPKP